MDIINLGKLIDPLEFYSYVVEAEKLETVVHNYGEQFKIPDYPCWMEYKNEGNEIGSISFTRNTVKHNILANLVEKIIPIIANIFNINKANVVRERIHLIRTLGNIPVHKDEAGRMTCINIGINNSSGAVTKVGLGGPKELFSDNHGSIILEDGHGYLLNTNEFHSVQSLNDLPRYLITYSMGRKFNDVKQFLVTQ